ncbi:MAG: nitroreductase family deazaflavin-dependent oxidoreductase [Ilumatobacteraceae bacterium]|nr:nitroreductase family deazaflavin-dependent oxidoreductase [Ilumatobacteraceae bacterium]
MSEPNEFNKKIIEEFRAHGGKVGGPFEGAPMVLLTTIGAKSGNQTTTPLVYKQDGDRIVIFASAAGAPKHPAWYHNLVANPQVIIEVGSARSGATAEVVTGDERDRIYAEQAAIMPGFAEYEAKTTRVIPVVALHRN